MKTCSSPFLSSKRSMLNPPPPLLELVLKTERVFLVGISSGILLSPLYRQPVTTGQSGSPSRKLTITSMPMRGMIPPPNLLPAHDCATRIQHELFSFFLP